MVQSGSSRSHQRHVAEQMTSIFGGASRAEQMTSLFGGPSRSLLPFSLCQDVQPHSRIQRKVYELGLQIQTLTSVFNDLQSEVFLEEQTDGRGSRKPAHANELPGDLSLLDAIMSGNTDHVRDALERGDVDPNETYSDISVNKKVFATATPLVVAALLQQRRMVQMLVAAGASVESTYSFVAGAEHKIWSGTVVHTTIPVGNLDLLKDLTELKADIDTVGSNGSNLVWQASYFGKPSILDHLLSMGLSFEQRAQSQDDSAVSYSPLHVAVTQGHNAIVQTLLSAQAQVAVEDGKGHTPLDDAVGEAHAEIVHQLILKNGDIFKQTPVTPEDFRHMQKKVGITNGQHLSAFDRIIRTENPVLLSRVIEALADAPSLLDRMSKHNLLQVLASPGDAPIHMMQALFQKQKLVYWEEQDGKTFRRQPKDAMVDTTLGMNVIDGPHVGKMMKIFGDKEPLPDNLVEFMNKLFPLVRMTKGQMYGPVTPYMCHLPQIHTDLHILMAFIDCPNPHIFECEGVVAIVSWAWNDVHRLSSFRVCLSVVELINFMVINVLMDETSATSAEFIDGPINLSNGIVSAVIWLIALFFETFQIVGYWSNHSIRRYFSSPRQWFGWLVLVMTGGFIIVFLTPGMQQSVHAGAFSAVLGILLFLKWFRMLIYLRQYKTIAVHTLPITSTMWNVGPFLLVMAVYLFASVNLFYALENDFGLEECVVIIYRLVVLGDFSLLELENRTLTSPRTQYYHFVRVMLVILSFVVSVTMMNLFIAVLCVAYDEAAKKVQIAFVKSLARIVLDAHATRKGLSFVRKFRCLRRRRTNSRSAVKKREGGEMQDEFGRLAKGSSERLTAVDVVQSDNSDSSFLWIVRPTEC